LFSAAVVVVVIAVVGAAVAELIRILCCCLPPHFVSLHKLLWLRPERMNEPNERPPAVVVAVAASAASQIVSIDSRQQRCRILCPIARVALPFQQHPFFHSPRLHHHLFCCGSFPFLKLFCCRCCCCCCCCCRRCLCRCRLSQRHTLGPLSCCRRRCRWLVTVANLRPVPFPKHCVPPAQLLLLLLCACVSFSLCVCMRV